MNNKNDEVKNIVISGGSKGLGAELVRLFLEKRHNVATFSRNENDFIIHNKDRYANNFYWESLNVSEPEKIKTFIRNVINRFSKIDILINNAATLHEGLLVFTSDDEITTLVNNNITAPILLTKECSMNMLRSGSGVILNISSINSVRGHKGVSIYSATKASLDGMTRSLARELGPSNIRVNSISPGFFESDLVSYLSDERRKQILKRTPLGYLNQIKELSKVVLFMCSDEAKFITGQNIIVDGGMTC